MAATVAFVPPPVNRRQSAPTPQALCLAHLHLREGHLRRRVSPTGHRLTDDSASLR